MNPPYGKAIPKWMQKATVEAKRGVTVVCFVPANTDTEWWWENCIQIEIQFLRGRLKSEKVKTIPTFASAVVILGPKIKSKVVWWGVQSKINSTFSMIPLGIAPG